LIGAGILEHSSSGVFSINPDAHSTDEVDLTSWGVLMARKGGIPLDRVLNCLSRDKLMSYLARRASPQTVGRSGRMFP
jgi:DNA polymerase (family 10)